MVSCEICKIFQNIYFYSTPPVVASINTAWKVSKSGVISGPCLPVFGLKTEIYGINIRIQSEYRKIRTRNNSVFGHFSRSESVWFFTTWRLIAKFHTHGLDMSSLVLIYSYSSNRKLRVKINDTKTYWSKILFGVPKVLSLLLCYSIFLFVTYFSLFKFSCCKLCWWQHTLLR